MADVREAVIALGIDIDIAEAFESLDRAQDAHREIIAAFLRDAARAGVGPPPPSYSRREWLTQVFVREEDDSLAEAAMWRLMHARENDLTIGRDPEAQPLAGLYTLMQHTDIEELREAGRLDVLARMARKMQGDAHARMRLWTSAIDSTPQEAADLIQHYIATTDFIQTPNCADVGNVSDQSRRVVSAVCEARPEIAEPVLRNALAMEVSGPDPRQQTMQHMKYSVLSWAAANPQTAAENISPQIMQRALTVRDNNRTGMGLSSTTYKQSRDTNAALRIARAYAESPDARRLVQGVIDDAARVRLTEHGCELASDLVDTTRPHGFNTQILAQHVRTIQEQRRRESAGYYLEAAVTEQTSETWSAFINRRWGAVSTGDVVSELRRLPTEKSTAVLETLGDAALQEVAAPTAPKFDALAMLAQDMNAPTETRQAAQAQLRRVVDSVKPQDLSHAAARRLRRLFP